VRFTGFLGRSDLSNAAHIARSGASDHAQVNLPRAAH
jgi:hypothetical protein